MYNIIISNNHGVPLIENMYVYILFLFAEKKYELVHM